MAGPRRGRDAPGSRRPARPHRRQRRHGLGRGGAAPGGAGRPRHRGGDRPRRPARRPARRGGGGASGQRGARHPRRRTDDARRPSAGAVPRRRGGEPDAGRAAAALAGLDDRRRARAGRGRDRGAPDGDRAAERGAAGARPAAGRGGGVAAGRHRAGQPDPARPPARSGRATAQSGLGAGRDGRQRRPLPGGDRRGADALPGPHDRRPDPGAGDRGDGGGVGRGAVVAGRSGRGGCWPSRAAPSARRRWRWRVAPRRGTGRAP